MLVPLTGETYGLLGAILIDDDVLADVSETVKPQDFYDKRHQLIFKSMMRLYEQHKPVDLLTLTEELKKTDNFETIGGSTYLTELTNYVPTAAHAASYAEIVAQKAVRRRLIKASGEISELGFDEEIPTQEILEKAEAELFNVSDQTIKQDLVSIEAILDESFSRIEELHRNKGQLRGIRTGYQDLDNMTAGLQRSDLFILAARPAMGKTTFVTNLAYNVATIDKLPAVGFGHAGVVGDFHRVVHLAAKAFGHQAGADAFARGVNGRRGASGAAANHQHVKRRFGREFSGVARGGARVHFLQDFFQRHAAAGEELAVQIDGGHAHDFARFDFLGKQRAVNHRHANARVEDGHERER